MKDRNVVFWDFDGVIKESVAVKTEAFGRLFAPFGADVAARVQSHHERHGGMSRFEKMPLYLGWAGIQPSDSHVQRFCADFAVLVRQAVIDSPWVPGVRDYMELHHARQRFVLVTATPQVEIESILEALGIVDWFRGVYGAPTAKVDAIRTVLQRWGCAPAECIMIGDSSADYQAAQLAGVDFLLRCTPLNRDLQRAYAGQQCEDFIGG